MKGVILESDASLKKKGRGSYDYRLERHTEVSIVKWIDNKPVHMASSFCAVAPVDQCQRWDGRTRSHVEVDRPCVVREYNKSMGGVDLSDMLLELYRTDIRSKKWYMRIVYYFLDLAVNNAWLLHRRECEDLGKQHMSLMYFKMDICRSLIVSGVVNSPRAGRPSVSAPTKRKTKTTEAGMPSESVRYDTAGHLPDTVEKGRCRYEKCARGATSRILCVKCKVRLCLNGDRNCFMNFHIK